MDKHPDLAALEAARTGESTPAETAHIESCPECRETMNRLWRFALSVRGKTGAPPAIPTPVRRSILEAAARAFQPVRASRRWRPLSAAAALLVAGLGLWIASRPAPRVEDLDRSGRVDILDAYALALRIESGAPLGPEWDLNGDGAVDRRDADEIARRGVALGGRKG